MSLQVKLALEGNLEKFTKDVTKRLSVAAVTAVESYARRLELKLRDDTRQGGLGNKVLCETDCPPRTYLLKRTARGGRPGPTVCVPGESLCSMGAFE